MYRLCVLTEVIGGVALVLAACAVVGRVVEPI